MAVASQDDCLLCQSSILLAWFGLKVNLVHLQKYPSTYLTARLIYWQLVLLSRSPMPLLPMAKLIWNLLYPPKIQVFLIPTTINWWDIVNVPILTSNSFIPSTCSSSPLIPLAFKEHGFKDPLMSSRLFNDTIAPVSTKHFRLWAPTHVLMKTAVGWTQFMGKKDARKLWRLYQTKVLVTFLACRYLSSRLLSNKARIFSAIKQYPHLKRSREARRSKNRSCHPGHGTKCCNIYEQGKSTVSQILLLLYWLFPIQSVPPVINYIYKTYLIT